MRDIKFEVFDTHLKTMQKDAHLYHEFIRYLNDDRYIKRQFTGLKDKNGIDIYEGDIVKWKCGMHYGTSRIDFSDGAFRLTDYFDKAVNNITENWMKTYSEVIGNIYENPELLNSN